jgi:DNA polymerase-3 subunit epsilon
MHYVIVDIETTGGNIKTSKITEIALFKYSNGEVLDSYSTLINPETRIPPFVVNLTGITNEMVAYSPIFSEVAQKIIDFTEGCVFVAHNVSFDYSMLRAEFKKVGITYNRPYLCTIQAARKIIPNHTSYSLGKITMELGISIQGRHRAGGDAYATVELFKLLEKKDKALLESQIKALSTPDNLHKSLDFDSVEELPSKVGIYLFYNEFNQLLYIGKSKNIRKKVEQHLGIQKQKRPDVFQKEISHIEFELTGSEFLATIKWVENIQTLKPIHNKPIKNTIYPYGIFKSEQKDTYTKLLVETLSKMQEDPILVFSTKKSALYKLQMLHSKYKLCSKLCGVQPANKRKDFCSTWSCQDVCSNEDPIHEYNERIENILASYTLKHKEFFIVEHGRNKNEKGIVFVRNNQFTAYGFAPYSIVQGSKNEILNYLKQKQENICIDLIVSHYLQNTKFLKIIPLR